MKFTKESSTILLPPWLQIARVFWVICTTLAILAFTASVVIAFQEPLPTCGNPEFPCGPWTMTQDDAAIAQGMGFPAGFVSLLYNLSSVFNKVVFIIVGLIIFGRRSDDWIALLLSLMLALFAVEGVINLGAAMPMVNFLYLIATIAFLLLPLIFPNGRFVPGWTKWVVLPFIILGSLVSILPQLPVAISDSSYSLALITVFGGWFILAGYSAVYRYRRVSNATERQQTKWVVAGILGTFLGFIPMVIITVWYPPVEPSPTRLLVMLLVYYPIYLLSYLFLPTGIAFAILRYRLWDIDVIIRKTMVYAIVSSILVLVFFTVVTLVSSILPRVTGQQSTMGLVLSTLLVAALFNPLRNRIQSNIDRRFYRKKYDSEQVLAHFSVVTRAEADLSTLINELNNVVNETMQPDKVSIWLRRN